MEILNKLLSFIKPPILFLIDSTNFLLINRSTILKHKYTGETTHIHLTLYDFFHLLFKMKKGSPMAALISKYVV